MDPTQNGSGRRRYIMADMLSLSNLHPKDPRNLNGDTYEHYFNLQFVLSIGDPMCCFLQLRYLGRFRACAKEKPAHESGLYMLGFTGSGKDYLQPNKTRLLMNCIKKP